MRLFFLIQILGKRPVPFKVRTNVSPDRKRDLTLSRLGFIWIHLARSQGRFGRLYDSAVSTIRPSLRFERVAASDDQKLETKEIQMGAKLYSASNPPGELIEITE